jgi:hypothetical protein
MDHETNKQEPSSKEGGKVKAGDIVWAQGMVIEVRGNSVRVGRGCGASWWMHPDHCRPVEPSNNPETSDSSSDPINPSHYKHLPSEAIDIIEAAIAGAPSNKAAYLHGQSLKYPLRCWEKGGVDDLKKARWYLDRLIKEVSE